MALGRLFTIDRRYKNVPLKRFDEVTFYTRYGMKRNENAPSHD